MPVIQADNLGDLVAATLKELGEMKFTEIATDLQNYVAMRNLLKKNRIVLDSGYGVQFDVMVTHSGAASFVGLGAVDNVNIGDTLIQGTAPWRHVTTNYAVIRQELAMNRTPRRIVDLLKVRRIDAMISLAVLMEDAFWSYPASTDTTTPYGVQYWIVTNATEGFNGGAQSGYTTVGGINPSTYTRWKNYTAQYVTVSKEDLIRKWRAAATKTKFMPPVDGIPSFNTGDQYGFFSNYDVIQALEEAVEAQNENLGNDLASKDGVTMFRRVPVTWVPKLDSDTTDPVYGINWGVFKTHVLRGEWLNETNIPVTPGQHTVASVHTDCTLNWICKDRRRNFVIYK